MKQGMDKFKKQSIRTQLLIGFLAITITIGGSAFFVVQRNMRVVGQYEEYLDYISKISQIARLQDESKTILEGLIFEVSEEEEEKLEEKVQESIGLLEEIKRNTESSTLSLRIRELYYLLQLFQSKAIEAIELKELEQEPKTIINYESSYYQVYLKATETANRIDTYLQGILLTSVAENKVYIATIEEEASTFRNIIVGVTLMITAISVYFYFAVTKYISSLVKKIIELTKRVSEGERIQPLELGTSPKEIQEFADSFNKLLITMDELSQKADEKAKLELQLAAEELEKLKMRELLKEAQLQGLQLQIQPHFLFNTLNVISMMAMLENSTKVYELLMALSKFLRHSLKKQSSVVPLLEEVDMVKQYLYIIKARLGEQLLYDIEVQTEDKNIVLPLFTLQPIVENAFKHGLEDKMEQGRLKVSIKESKGQLRLRVFDNGKGMGKEALSRIRNKVNGAEIRFDQEKHIGIENVANRLDMIYGESVRYLIHSNPKRGTIFTIYIKL